MVRIECRRQADPQMVKRLWEAITFIRQQKQVANNERIQKYMQRQYGTSETDCMSQVCYASEDNLLLKEISTGKKGSRVGLAQEAFWCVEDTDQESKDSHDWYCFTCHRPGTVWCCDTCHRVYHPQCLDEVKKGIEEEKWSCAACLSLEEDSLQVNKGTLYRLLDFVLARMKDKARELHRKLKLTMVPNYYHLVYRHVDLGTIMENVEMKRYKTIDEFELSAQDMMHTSAVYYGIGSDRASLSQLTLNDCRYDLAEIRLCVDCYLASNNKVRDDWFCTPCSPVHELAWVHMKGFGCWPAKILHKNEGKVDVRFFGRKHERALVPEGDVKPIDTDLSKLRIKKNKGWENARKELEHHKVLVQLGVTAVRDEVVDNEEEEDRKPAIDAKEARAPSTKKGTKRKLDQREAEELVKKSHSDAGQVNSISTSQEAERARNGTPRPKKKRRKTKTPKPPEGQDTEPPAQEPSEQEIPDFDAPDAPMEGDEPPVKPEEETLAADGMEEPGGDIEGEGWKEEVGRQEEGEEKYSSGSSKKEEKEQHPKVKKEGAKSKKGADQKGKKESSKKGVKEEDDKATTKEEESASERANTKGKKGKSLGGGGGKSRGPGGSSGMDEEDFENKYRQKLADYKAHQEMEFQARIEKAVEEAVNVARKKWEMESMATDAGTIAVNEELIEEARREEGDRLKEEHENAVTQLKEQHKEEISQTKKRQWCINCEQEAMYHCCWNTSYCSISCQQIHWHKDHKRLCRRKR